MMKIGLIGYTGFVGSNILKQLKDSGYEDRELKLYNSKNIKSIYGENFDLLIISGVSANKTYANMSPKDDLFNISSLYEDLKRAFADKVVVISTIDVFMNDAYGQNRKYFENKVKSISTFKTVKILRLPGLFGSGLKKNSIYDMMNLIPTFIKHDKFIELSKINSKLFDWYSYNTEKNVYEVAVKNKEVEQTFKNLGFTSLNFSNATSDFCWFNLQNVLSEIWDLIDSNSDEITITSQSITNEEIAKIIGIDLSLFKSPIVVSYKLVNIIGKIKVYPKEEILSDIKRFVNASMR